MTKENWDLRYYGCVTEKAEQVLVEALRLRVRARADIAGKLLDSLDGRAERGVEEAWADEIERRIRDVDSGRVKLVPWSEVRRELRKKVSVRKSR